VVHTALVRLSRLEPRRGWVLSVYEAAGEAGGSFRATLSPPRSGRVSGPAQDSARASAEAARRARAKVRRYCAANRLNRLGTLTYAGVGCHEMDQLVGDVGLFFRRLRRGLGGDAFPYLWVPEWHKSGHGLHVHFAVGQYIKRSLIAEAWGHGFVHIKLLGDLPVGSGALEESRKAAGYLSKYVGKAFSDSRVPGRNRYDVAQGFQPTFTQVWGTSRADAIRAASLQMGGRAPSYVWVSDHVDGWAAPPAVWVQWPG